MASQGGRPNEPGPSNQPHDLSNIPHPSKQTPTNPSKQQEPASDAEQPGHSDVSADSNQARRSVQLLPLRKGIGKYYTVRQTGQRAAPAFGGDEASYSVEIIQEAVRRIEEEDSQSPFEILLDILQHLLTTLTRGLHPDDLIQVNINAPGRLDYPIALPMIRVSMLTLELLLETIERVLNSNEQFKIDDLFEIRVVTV